MFLTFKLIQYNAQEGSHGFFKMGPVGGMFHRQNFENVSIKLIIAKKLVANV